MISKIYIRGENMNRKLKSILIVFFIFLILFISFVIISEYRNMEKLRSEYKELPEEVYKYRKESLDVWAINLILTFLVPLLFLVSKISYKIRCSIGNEKSLFVTGLLYGIIFFLLMFIINAPLNYYNSFHLAHKYGLSNQTFLRWIEVTLKGFVINDLFISLFIFIPFYIIGKNPNTWWLKLGMMFIPVIIFMVFVSPMFIDPIFNKYTSIEDEKLGIEINEVLENAGISNASIYKVDKSKDTKTMNAYMTGIFGTKRIVLWDTTIDNLEESEVISITAHEVGHYLENHIWKNILINSIGSILILFLVYITSNNILNLSYGTFGIKKLSDVAALPLLLLVLNFYSFLSMPIENYISRYMETQADGYEISLTNDRESAVSAMKKLYDTSLGIPRPSNIYKIWYHSHPTLEERIEFYKDYPIE